MNAMKMDAKRSICSVKMIIIIVALVFTLIFSSWDMIRASKKDIFACGVIDMLGTALMMDKFKVLMVMFTAGIYTAGFCYDFKHHYIRMILARTDLISYSISKFIVNTVAVVFVDRSAWEKPFLHDTYDLLWEDSDSLLFALLGYWYHS